jgi:uncharacterized paraquat-inducible protein A
MTTFDITRERLRERLTEPRSDYGLAECESCNATLTQADIDADECSQCHASLMRDMEDEFDWYNENGLFDDCDD